jgi:hypothetical protein
VTEEVDPRLVALGLIPAPPGWREQQAAQVAAVPVAAPPAPNPFATPSAPTPAPTGAPAAPGELFPGMGKFTGMPPETATPQSAPAQPMWDAPAAPPAQPQWTTPAQFSAPPVAEPPVQSPPAYTPPAFTPPAYTPHVAPAERPAVAPPMPEAPVREAPPPLPPLASAMPAAPAVEAPPIVDKKAKKEKKGRQEKPPKADRPEKVATVARVARIEKAKAPPKPRYQLPPSGVLLRGPVVMGYPERSLQITLEQLGFRVNAKEPIEVPWTSVKKIESRRGRVVVRVKGARPVAFGIPVEGISEPTLSGPLSKVVKEASGGSLDLAGSAFLELQNATDSLRDHFHDEDDPLIPTVVGLVFVLASLTVSALLPDILAIATRTPVAPGGYLVDSPLALIDPRILAASFAAGAMLAAGVVRVAMGKGATAWARGTLRGWHGGGRRVIDLARRALAAIVLSPAIAAAVLLLSIVLSLPSMRVQTVIDESGFHITRAIPFFDENRSWANVTGIETIPAPTVQHFEGIAVVFTFKDQSPVSTLDGRLHGGTDKQLFEAANTWWSAAR